MTLSRSVNSQLFEKTIGDVGTVCRCILKPFFYFDTDHNDHELLKERVLRTIKKKRVQSYKWFV